MKEEHLRQRLIELMRALGVNQAEFARATGIDATAVSGLLLAPDKKGRRNLGLKTMGKICTAYGLDEGWFHLPLGSQLPGQKDDRRAQFMRLVETMPDEQFDTVARLVGAITQTPSLAVSDSPSGVIPIAPYIKPRTHDVSTLGAIRVMESLPEGVRHAALAHLQTFAEYYKRSADGQALRGAVEKSRAIRQA